MKLKTPYIRETSIFQKGQKVEQGASPLGKGGSAVKLSQQQVGAS